MEVEPEEEENCKICMEECDAYDDPAVSCVGECEQSIHVRCLKRGTLPSNLIGDVFYDLHCADCSGEEMLVRQKLSWLTTVVLTLYNLSEKSPGLSRRGYYHWKSDISTFINNNWDHLFGKSVKRKKNWTGTISGTLSHCSGSVFKSGTAELGDQGWWKLVNNGPPEIIVGKYYRELEIKKKEQKEKNPKRANADWGIIGNNNRENELPKHENNQIPRVRKNGFDQHQNHSVNSTPYNEFADILDLGIDKPNLQDDFPSFNFTAQGLEDDLPFQNPNELPQSFLSDCLKTSDRMDIDESSEDLDIASTSNEKSKDVSGSAVVISKEEFEDLEDQNDVVYDRSELPLPEPTLFNQSVLRPWPWDESIKLNPEDLRPLMNIRQEEYLLQKIEQFKHLLDSAPSSVRRLYRKLCVRRMKRQYGLPILNVDDFGKDSKVESSSVRRKGNAVLDRFISEDLSMFFEQRLQGLCEPTSVHSPYTSRILKPFIRRDTSSRPLWMKLMSELLTRVNGKIPHWKQKPIAPIDYSYIRPQHIPAINCLCTQFFWPGVDLTECLQYPDFTCVVLYKKLVIGFAIMVPDVGYNEAYISFLLVRPEWQKAGIGSFMLYHLIQTCMGKDITLHVSATNPALILYQKFGFKQEEFVQDFYDKYMSVSSRESKHAIFLRLRR
ncbi:hypothetical protein QAD02_005455 [Eretmocerus hayati]|uniref:Uncharacterized protein n=1 Tax=Eretmocerus hayati TaxID=131215 RepID=A0ACC2NTK2_9HYME|nr:hypothetical protein QAD02_005455 [Eretmocerus hayati]